MMIMRFPLGYYNCAQVIPMFFGFLLLVFNGVQEDIEADQTNESPLSTRFAGRPERDARQGYYNCALVIPMFFGFLLLLVFNGAQEDIEANRASVIPMFFGFLLLVFNGVQEGIEAHGSSASLNAMPAKVYVAYTVGLIFFACSFYFGSRQAVPPTFKEMATAADWMSGASLVGMAGTLYALGYNGLAYIIGWTGGYVLVSIMIAPHLRRFGSVTGEKIVELSGVSRFLATIELSVYSTGLTVSRFIDIQFEMAVFSCLFSVLFCSLLEGMRAVTYTQVAQYVILIIAYTVPAICMSTTQDDGFNQNNPVELFAYGGTLHQNALKEKGAQLLVPVSGDHRALSCSFTSLTAQVYSTGVIVSRFMCIQFEVAVFICLISVLFCSLLGGMRAVTYTQVAQYGILIIAYTVPAICMSTAQDDGFNQNKPVELFSYGGTLHQNALKEKGVPVPGDRRALSCSFTYLTAQVYSTGVIASLFVGIQFEVAVFICLISVLFCSLLGGMRAVTYTQVAQYVILVIAYTVPAICMSTTQDDGFNKNKPVELFAYGGTLHQNAQREGSSAACPGSWQPSCSLSCSFTYLAAQIYSTGVIVSRFIRIQFEVAVFSCLFSVLFCSLLGGMRAVTYTQVVQYVILIIAYTVPAICMSTTQPEWRRVNFFALTFCLMAVTASLPCVLKLYFTTPSVRSARRSVTWSLGFILVLYMTAPAYAAFAKWEVYTNVIGTPLPVVPQWIFTCGKIGLTTVCRFLFVIFTLGMYAAMWITSRTSKSNDFNVADRNVPPTFKEMATAADWMSGASLAGMAGTLYALGYDGLAYIIGWTGGHVLVSIVIAPCSFTYLTAQVYSTGVILSRLIGIRFEVAVFSAYTVPAICMSTTQDDGFSMNNPAKLLAYCALAQQHVYALAHFALGQWGLFLRDTNGTAGPNVHRLSFEALFSQRCLCMLLGFSCAIQVHSTDMIVSRFTGIQFGVAVFSGLIGVLFCSLLEGMRAVTYTQRAQYVILIIAYTMPAMCMSTTQEDGFNMNNPVEFLAYGRTLQQTTLREKELVLLGLASKLTPYLEPKWRREDFFDLPS
ncbi:unnamed protein product, partial [Polarella glacialis]